MIFINVLVACEESQVVCKAFLNKGHNAFSCDLQHCSGGLPQRHIVSDVLLIINGNVSFTCQDGSVHFIDKWDLLIAHPPCTYLSRAGACNFYKNGKFNIDRYNKGLAAKEFFLTLFNCNIEKKCIENPLPMSIFNLPKFSQIVQPYEFSETEKFSKRTLLWLVNLPFLAPTVLNLTNEKFPSWCRLYHSPFIRSKTFTGIALAMAEQWG